MKLLNLDIGSSFQLEIMKDQIPSFVITMNDKDLTDYVFTFYLINDDKTVEYTITGVNTLHTVMFTIYHNVEGSNVFDLDTGKYKFRIDSSYDGGDAQMWFFGVFTVNPNPYK
jgi:hypothetical protein